MSAKEHIVINSLDWLCIVLAICKPFLHDDLIYPLAVRAIFVLIRIFATAHDARTRQMLIAGTFELYRYVSAKPIVIGV